MKILILSDSHYRNIELDLTKYDYVIHCGDYGNSYDLLEECDAYYVRGNCDMRGPKERFFEINGKNILVVHGDLYNVKSHYNSLVYKGLERKANFVFFGHTHRMDMFIENDIVFINPGCYMDDEYVVIGEKSINFYIGKKKYKSFEYRW